MDRVGSTFAVAPVRPEGLKMTIQVKIQITLDLARCLYGIAAILAILI
jgi:hypothetical protein